MKSLDRLRHPAIMVPASMAAAALALGACSSESASEPAASASPAISTEAGTARCPALGDIAPPTAGPTQYNLLFDALGGGSCIIQVYPGTSDVSADRQANGTYTNGDVRPVDCQETGRDVHSHPELGEAARESDVWYHLITQDGVTQFASAVYADAPPNVPSCK